MGSVTVILIFFDVLKTFFPLLAFLGNVLYRTWLNSASSSLSSLICCFVPQLSQHIVYQPLHFCKGGAISQSADTADADDDEDVGSRLESLYFSCPPTIVDEQCKVNVIVGVLIWKKWREVCWFEKIEELCSLSLVDTVILNQCANALPWFEMKPCLVPAVTSEILRNSICIFFGCFKTKQIICILVI